MPDTMQQVVAGIYTLLRRPDEVKLPYQDVLEVVNDLLRGYTQDMSLNSRDLRTEVAEAQIVADDIDYILSLPNVPDFELVKLEHGALTGVTDERAFYSARLVPLDGWENHFSAGYTAASVYGSASLQEGVKVKLNMTPEQVGEQIWRVTYRLPVLTVVQMGERPPIPSAHLPMLKREAAIHLMPMVRDDSKEWVDWMSRTIPIYTGELLQDKERWRAYLDESVEGSVQPIKRFDDYRAGWRRRFPRAYLPIGS